MVNSDIMDKLIKFHNQKLTYYRSLLNLSQKQKRVISNEKFRELNQILDQKKEIIEKIKQLDVKLQPYKTQVINEFDLDEEHWLLKLVKQNHSNNKLDEIVEQLEKTLEKLSQLDKENQNLLQSKRDKLKSELKDVRQGVQLNKSYGNNKNKRIHSTYIDEKS